MVRFIALIEDDSVLAVTAQLAGYFDELGITVSVKTDTSDEVVLVFKEKIAPVLSAAATPLRCS